MFFIIFFNKELRAWELRAWTGTSMAAPHISGAIARKLSDGQEVSKNSMSLNYNPVLDLSGLAIRKLGPNC